MIITAPVTDYIPASVLTTLNDIIVRGAAIPERLPGLLRSLGVPVGYATRNAAGVQEIRGVGHAPSLILFFAHGAANMDQEWSIGFGDGTDNRCIYKNCNLDMMYINARVIYFIPAPGVNYECAITGYDPDGFDLTWIKNGAPNDVGFIYVSFP